MILLTGGTGLLGLHIVDELRRTGLPVQALTRRAAASEFLAARGAVPLEGTVEDPATWERISGVSAIVHSAATIAGERDWGVYHRTNVEGTRNAARRARALGIPLIHISSVAVYGAHAEVEGTGPVSEDFPVGSPETGSFYARSKRLAEVAVRAEMDRGLRAIILRPCVVYGPGDRLFLPALLGVARRGIFPVIGGGHRPLAIVHARNVALAVTAALGATAGCGGTFNVCNDDEITGRELAACVELGIGRRLRRIRLPAGLSLSAAALADGIRGLWGDAFPEYTAAIRFLRGPNPYTSHALRTALGWRPVVRHCDGLPEALRVF